MTVWTEHLPTWAPPLAMPPCTLPTRASEARAATETTIKVPLLHLGTIRSVRAGFRGLPAQPRLQRGQEARSRRRRVEQLQLAQGRMIASFLMWSEAEGVLALSADILPAFLKKFSMYVLRSKVKLANASADVALIGVAGPNAATIVHATGAELPAPT